MIERGIDQIILSDLTSIRYLVDCVVPPMQFLAVVLINQEEKPLLITFAAALAKTSENVKPTYYLQHQDGVEFLASHIKKEGLVAIDKKFPFGYFERLKKQVNFNYIVDDIVDGVRVIKEEEEKEYLRKASSIADQVMVETKAKLKIGVKESEIKTFIEKRVFELGGEGLSFYPTIAFGSNTGRRRGDDRALEKGDNVLLDFGCKYNGYCSDITRIYTFRSNKEAEKLYRVVLEAQKAAYSIIKPNIKIKEAAKAARKVIEDSGYGANNHYHLGHGVGLGIHEIFYVSLTNEDVFKPGMCFSVEPGIYFPGIIGSRVEDLVLVTEDGVEILNKVDKEDIFLD